jgi:superfamily II DNA or RNA helicase
MNTNEALSRWFINDSMNAGNYRLKGHAINDFWKWVSSWAIMLDTPSDIGFSDEGYILPELIEKKVFVSVDHKAFTDEKLFKDVELSATSYHAEMRGTIPQRARAASELIKGSDEQWIIWCNANYEADELIKLLPAATEVRGNDTPGKKENAAVDFADGKIQILISKPSMFGFGLNFQNCHNVIFVGLSYSYEQLYQAIKRVHRFGQKSAVNAYLILSDTEYNVLRTIKEKRKLNEDIKQQMLQVVRKEIGIKKERKELNMDYERNEWKTDECHLINGDCVEEIKTIPDDSVHFSIFSPPFANLYI